MARERVLEEVRTALAEDRCEAAILGCAGMAYLAAWIMEDSGAPVIDGVVAGVRLVEALADAGLRTSKIGTYAAPLAK